MSREKGYNTYIIPVGATTPSSVLGYVLAIKELINQFDELEENLDYVVCACGTGGTQAGLMLGAKIFDVETKIIGTSVFASKNVASRQIAQLINGSAELLDIDLSVSAEEVTVFDEYIREGYGVLNNAVAESLRLLAETEGIFLDPVYTAKAMVAIIDLTNKGYFKEDDSVVLLHTGGLPALFAYREELDKI